MSFFRSQPKIPAPLKLVRLYVIGGNVNNIEFNGSSLSNASGLTNETEKNSFTFSELIPAFNTQNTVRVYRDFAKANGEVTRHVKEKGKKELVHALAYSDMVPEESDTVAVPIFELLVPTDFAEKLLIDSKEDTSAVVVKREALKNYSPLCGIIKDKIVYQDKSAQKYHDIFVQEFQIPYETEQKIEPKDVTKKDWINLEYKIHSAEALERAAHRVKPSPVLASTLTQCFDHYNNPGLFTRLFGDRSQHDRIKQLQQYFANKKHSNTLKPIDCAQKFAFELEKPGINPGGEYAKMLRVLLTSLNVNYKHHGNTLDWMKELDDQIEKTPLQLTVVKNLVFSYVDPSFLTWKDSHPEVKEEEKQVNKP